MQRVGGDGNRLDKADVDAGSDDVLILVPRDGGTDQDNRPVRTGDSLSFLPLIMTRVHQNANAGTSAARYFSLPSSEAYVGERHCRHTFLRYFSITIDGIESSFQRNSRGSHVMGSAREYLPELLRWRSSARADIISPRK